MARRRKKKARWGEMEQEVVEDKEREGIWAWVLASESVMTTFIKVQGGSSEAAH